MVVDRGGDAMNRLTSDQVLDLVERALDENRRRFAAKREPRKAARAAEPAGAQRRSAPAKAARASDSSRRRTASKSKRPKPRTGRPK
jgi:sRNA-binding protein